MLSKLLFNSLKCNGSFFAFIFIFLSGRGVCDIIPENSHYVNRCVKIMNAGALGDYTLLGCIKSPMNQQLSNVVINSDACLEAGYKFNVLYVVAVKSAYLSGKGVDTTNWLMDKNALKCPLIMTTEGYYTGYDDPVSSVEELYKVQGVTDTSLLLYKCLETIKYLDGRPAQITEYEPGKAQGKLISGGKVSAWAGKYLQNRLQDFFLALTQTVFVELCILLLLFKTRFKTNGFNIPRLLLAGTLPSVCTLPVLWFVLPAFLHPAWLYMLGGEIFVILMEGVLIKQLLTLELRKAMLVSLLCNAGSFFTGLLITFIVNL